VVCRQKIQRHSMKENAHTELTVLDLFVRASLVFDDRSPYTLAFTGNLNVVYDVSASLIGARRVVPISRGFGARNGTCLRCFVAWPMLLFSFGNDMETNL